MRLEKLFFVATGLFLVSEFGYAQGARVPALAEMAATTCKSTACDQKEIRLQHARELLGRHYRKSVVKAGESISRIDEQILKWTKKYLPKKYQDRSQQVAKTIIDESRKHGFDPVFLLSVIFSESSFVPEMRGRFGEIGLMQIKPSTGKWISEMNNLVWKGEETLLDPVENIRIGAEFLHYLRVRFDSHAQLYLAAYNMGRSNVLTARSRNVWPKDYPTHVMKNYVAFYEQLGGPASRSISSETKSETKQSANVKALPEKKG